MSATVAGVIGNPDPFEQPEAHPEDIARSCMSRGCLALSLRFGSGVRCRGIGRGIGVVVQPISFHGREAPAIPVDERVATGLGLPAFHGDVDVGGADFQTRPAASVSDGRGARP
mgnify:CR=1 FL=1